MENFNYRYRNNFVLEFLDYFVESTSIHNSECIERGLTYSVPLKAKVKKKLIVQIRAWGF
jgi:DNA-directed RNA polymerase subunit beta